MNTAADRTELVREAVFSVVAEHFPQERGLLPSVWAWWVQRVALQRGSGGLPPGGLAAIGATGDESYTAVLLLAFSAIICEWPVDEKRPSNRDVAEAIAAAAPRLGLRGERLRRVIDASTSKLCEVLGRLSAPSTPRKFALRSPEALWVEELRAGTRTAPIEVGFLKHAELVEAEGFDLVIDEFRRRFRGGSGWTPFSAFTPRSLVSVWLALEHTGRSFGHNEIEAVRRRDGDDDAGRRKYATLARKALSGLIGREIVAPGRHLRYDVPLEAWTWRWTRLSPDPQASRLIRD